LNKIIKAHIALFSANLIFGLNYVIAKGIMPDYLSPRAIIFIRTFWAAIVFWMFHRFFIKEKVNKKDILKLALCAACGVAFNQILFFEGLNLTTAINSSLIFTSTPIIVLVLSIFLLGERITKNNIIGLTLGLSGAIMLILNEGKISFESDTFVGNLLTMTAATSYSIYLVLIKPLALKYKPITLLKWIFIFGFLLASPFCFNNFMETNWETIPTNIWLSVLYVVFGTTIIAYLLNNYSLQTLSPTVVSVYIYSQPIIATIIAMIFRGEKLYINNIIAGILIFIGIYFVGIKKIKKTSAYKIKNHIK
jgi:drug/metabolite transporter (DMT)-like permease